MQSDLISRKDVITALIDADWIKTTAQQAVITEVLNKIPSVKPKKGKWIAEKKTIWHEYYDDAYEEEITVWKCSNCNYDMGTIKPDDYKRCPNCGEKKEEE